MSSATDLAELLVSRLDPHERAALKSDPWRAVEELFSLGISVVQSIDGDCETDGTYDPHTGTIQVLHRASSRRMEFSLLHELGHARATEDSDCVVALLERSGSRAFEEDIAHAFAAELLIPRALVDEVRRHRNPTARHLVELFERSRGSRSACAVRIAQQCPGDGYVIVAQGAEVRFAAPFGTSSEYRIRSGTVQPHGSSLALASEQRTGRGSGQLAFPSGAQTPEFLFDSVTQDDGYVFAIFSNSRQAGWVDWLPPDTPAARAEPPTVFCRRCDEERESWNRCDQCRAWSCDKCGTCPRCSPSAAVDQRMCEGCWTLRPASAFDPESGMCTDMCS